ncbi:MAG: hypothetical protein WAQ28_08850 [Bacteroidia bacterium]
MNTEAKVQRGRLSSAEAKATENKAVSEFFKNAEFNRFGIIPVLLLLVGCMGGFAASYGAGESAFKLAAVAFPSIIALAMMLAVAPMRLVFWTSAIAILLDLVLLVF